MFGQEPSAATVRLLKAAGVDFHRLKATGRVTTVPPPTQGPQNEILSPGNQALYPNGADNAHPSAVADEIVRVLALPRGEKPFRTVIDFTESGVEKVNASPRKPVKPSSSG